MNINISNTIRLSPSGRGKIINDFFSNIGNEFNKDSFTDAGLAIHARAFCLYSALLTTKVCESLPEDIVLEGLKENLRYMNILETHQAFYGNVLFYYLISLWMDICDKFNTSIVNMLF